MGLEADADDIEGGDWVGLLAKYNRMGGVRRSVPINDVNKLPDTADSIFCPVVISTSPF